jgi:HAD superfamily hydrolase (TIGR01509 family)
MAPGRDAVVKAVLFDVDGTLLDTNYLHVVAWLRAFAAAGISVPAKEIHHRIGMSGDRLVDELAGGPRPDVSERWRQEYDAMKPDIRALPDARALLLELGRRGLRVGLATSSPAEDVDTMRAVLDVDDVLAFTTSAGDVDEAKPAPDIFQTALAEAGVPRSDALVVGDTVWDVVAARRCGLDCVGVLTGGISRAELERAGAIAVYESTSEILTQLDTSPLVQV